MKRFFSVLTVCILVIALMAAIALPAFAAELKTAIGIVTARGGLRLRAQPNTSASILATAHYNDSVVIIEKDGDWYRVNFNLLEGYMHADYLQVKQRENVRLGIGKVDVSAVNLRGDPSTANSPIGLLTKGKTVQIIGFNTNWYKVQTDTLTGYIRSDLLALTEKPYDNYGVGSTYTPTTGSSGQKIADYAKNLVGCPYVYGGTTTAGFDCSGFVQYVYAQCGYSINRTATAQLSNGTAVSYSNLLPGDIVYFGSGSIASHVGIYIGNGQFVHAQNSNTGVVISSLSETWYANRYLTAHRIVN